MIPDTKMKSHTWRRENLDESASITKIFLLRNGIRLVERPCQKTKAFLTEEIVFLRTWRFITLMLAALGMTLGAAHVLELPPKMQYSAELYMAVTSTLYRLFGTVGAVIQVSAVLMAVVLSFLVRGRQAFRWTLYGTLCLVLSLVLWFALVQPVNAEWRQALQSTPEFAAKVYLQLREQWEYGHVAAFIAWFVGVGLLVFSLIVETPMD